MTTAYAYVGPQCPHCSVPLSNSMRRTGLLVCEFCRRSFEATVFTPLARRGTEAVETIVAAGPAGANACANHARNAAVTSCQRCGLFICSLCDMNVGAGSFCPTCFDRVRAEGTLKPVATRYRDFASLARITAIFGLVFYFVWPIIGAGAIFLAVKGMRQRREQGRSRAGMVIIMILGVIEIIAGITLYGFFIWAIARGMRG